MNEDFKLGFIGVFETIKLRLDEQWNNRFHRRAGACVKSNIVYKM